MKTSGFTELQILAIQRQAEGGVPVSVLCCEHGMSNGLFYTWRSKYRGMDALMISQMKALEDCSRKAIDPVNLSPGGATVGSRNFMPR